MIKTPEKVAEHCQATTVPGVIQIARLESAGGILPCMHSNTYHGVTNLRGN